MQKEPKVFSTNTIPCAKLYLLKVVSSIRCVGFVFYRFRTRYLLVYYYVLSIIRSTPFYIFQCTIIQNYCFFTLSAYIICIMNVQILLEFMHEILLNCKKHAPQEHNIGAAGNRFLRATTSAIVVASYMCLMLK